MDMQELNKLLQPFKISIECNSCESVAKNPFQPRSLNQKVEITAKKMKKISKAKPSYPDLSEQQTKSAGRKCKTDRKNRNNENVVLKNHSPMSTALKNQEQMRRQFNFFMELKQSGDNFLNCPQFENPQNNDNIKPQAFDYEATAATLNTEANDKRIGLGDISSLRKNLFDDMNFGFENEFDNCVANDMGYGLAFDNKASDEFELDFGQLPAGSDFFSYV